MIQIDMKSHKSIYQQVVDNVKELIMCDLLPADSKLPSVRDLSRQLTINPNTVQKAYRELERQGYIYTQSGMGTFVADKKGIRADDAAMTKAEQGLEDAFKQLLYLGVDFDAAKDKAVEIMNRIRKEGVVI